MTRLESPGHLGDMDFTMKLSWTFIALAITSTALAGCDLPQSPQQQAAQVLMQQTIQCRMTNGSTLMRLVPRMPRRKRNMLQQ